MAGCKLKVFEAQFGFYDSVVAAPSRAAALQAWGTHENLFAGGLARITEDPQAIAAALAHPLMPLKRAVGSKDAFALEATSLPTGPDRPKRQHGSTAPRAPARPKAPAAPPADRTKLDAAEAACTRSTGVEWGKRRLSNVRRRTLRRAKRAAHSA